MNIKTTTIIIASAIAFAACANGKRGGSSGDSSQSTGMSCETAAAKGFTEIVTEGSFDVYYTPGDSTTIQLRGDKKAVSRTVISSDGRTLTISCNDEGLIHIGHKDDVDVYITSPRLNGVSINGSGDFKSESNLTADKMSISIAGSGDVELRSLDCGECTLTIEGSGDIGVDRIKAGKLTAAIAGSGDIDLSNADIENAECAIAGAGDIDIDGRVGTCEKSVAGVGTIDINP